MSEHPELPFDEVSNNAARESPLPPNDAQTDEVQRGVSLDSIIAAPIDSVPLSVPSEEENNAQLSAETSPAVSSTLPDTLPEPPFQEFSKVEPQLEPFAHAKYGYAAVFCIFLMYQFAGGALHSALRSVHSSALATILQGVGQALFMFVPTMFVMRYSPLKVQGLMRLSGSVTPLQWSVGLLGIFGVQIFDAGFLILQDRLMPSFLLPAYHKLSAWSELVEQAYRDFFAGTTSLQALRALIVGAVVPAFAEEVLFRGLFQRSLEQVRPARHAIIVTALIFGILHFNPLSVIPLMLIGVYLGFLAYYTQSLALPIVAHFLSNAIAIVALYAPKQDTDLPPETLPLAQAFLLAFIGIVILGGAFLTILRHTPQSPPTTPDAESIEEENSTQDTNLPSS
jgi:membrane protease YdiL (CAAX protease family)